MAGNAWTDAENDLVIEAYFAMLGCELAGKPVNKSAHRRALLPLLNARNDGAIEFKHQNISAVLKGLGQPSIAGYKPAFNFQKSLDEAVVRWLDQSPDWISRAVQVRAPRAIHDPPRLWVGPSPTQSNQPPPQEAEQLRAIALKFDVAGRDARNRALGRAGEQLVLAYERATLDAMGKPDLARRVRWVSEQDGDGAGYDIASFTAKGAPRLIEVKTTNGWERTPFHISRNELAVAKEQVGNWCVFRLWNFARTPQAFELYPPLEAHVSLTATSYQASFP